MPFQGGQAGPTAEERGKERESELEGKDGQPSSQGDDQRAAYLNLLPINNFLPKHKQRVPFLKIVFRAFHHKCQPEQSIEL